MSTSLPAPRQAHDADGRPAPAADVGEIARAVERVTGDLARDAIARMQETLPWFAGMPAEQRATIGLIVQSGLRGFAQWMQAPDEGLRIGSEVFAVAPDELARLVSLAQTVELVRAAVDVAESWVGRLAAPADHAWLRDAVLRYSRDIAFTVALVYARAAEQRGAWDARLEALVVDGVVRGVVDDALLSRAAALGWSTPTHVVAVVGLAPAGRPDPVIDALHQRGAAAGADVLGGVQGERLVALVGTTRRLNRVVRSLLPTFAPGPVVVGPTVGGLGQAPGSARAALSGLRVAGAWPAAPRPVASEDLLPERAVAGDTEAADRLVQSVWQPLTGDQALLDTAEAFLEHGGSIEATARALWVHPNTVRYRLNRVGGTLGRDIHNPRDRYAMQLGISLGRLRGGL
jgi:hypothetical protein